MNSNSQEINFAWATQVGGTTQYYFGTDLVIDQTGNVYTTGPYRGSIDFEPGSAVNILTSSLYFLGYECNAFITKSDNFGNLVWAKSLSGASTGNSLCVDSAGNVYVTGRFSGTVDFDPDTATTYYLSTSGSDDIFICKFNPSGNLIWAKKLGNVSQDNGLSITTDNNGNLYISGHNHSPMDYDPGSAVFTPAYNGFTAFVLKLDWAGNFVWAKGFTCNYQIWATSVSVDVSGNVIVAGWFDGTADFDPDPLISNIHSSTGMRDIFVVKLNSIGNLIWVNCIGGYNNDEAHSVTTDFLGNVYFIGSFYGTADFDPGAAVCNLSSTTLYGICICKFDPTGTLTWAKKIDGNSFYITYNMLDIKCDNETNIYATGRFAGTTDFDPGAGVFNLSACGTIDAFTLKLNSAGNFIWAYNIGGSSGTETTSVAIDDIGNVYTSGTFRGTADFNPDTSNYSLSAANETDYFIMKMIQRISTNNTLSATVCDSMVSPSGNYTWDQTGTYTDTIPNMFGLDSIITIYLTILNSTSQIVNKEACYYYDFNGSTLFNSGTYYDTIQNSNGCDSIITLNLTIVEVDNSVVQNANELTAIAVGASYQWIDCNNGFAPVQGATNQTFTPTVNGSYAVIIYQNGCVDTSTCYTVSTIGNPIKETAATIKIYPNPTLDQLLLDLGQPFKHIKIEVINAIGQVVIEKEYRLRQNFAISLLQLQTGEYLVKVYLPEKQPFVQKIIKK